jgi:hypothetical protein
MGSAGVSTAGVVWAGTNPYNNATEKFDGSSWSTSGNLPTSGSYGNGCGTQGAALSISLYQGSPFGVCNEYNGSSWSGGGTIPNNNYSVGGCGTQTAGVCVGGDPAPNPPGGTQHQHYNGTSWTAKTSLPANRTYYGNGVIGSQDDTYASAGGDPTSGLSGEYFNGTAWTSQGTLPSLRGGASSTNAQSNGSENGLIMAGGSPISATVLTIAPSVGAPASRDISVAT